MLHLEKALQAVEDAMASIHPKAKSKSSEQDKENRKLAKYIIKLEERASARGESGLAICLSKPFQRLLKYPLLFQVSHCLPRNNFQMVELTVTQRICFTSKPNFFLMLSTLIHPSTDAATAEYEGTQQLALEIDR